jgi:hypothetical protein
VVLNFYFLLVEMKSVTLAFDRAIDGGLRFSDLTVFLIFCSTKVFHFRRFCKKKYSPMSHTTVRGNTPCRYEEYYRPSRIEHWHINSTVMRQYSL